MPVLPSRSCHFLTFSSHCFIRIHPHEPFWSVARNGRGDAHRRASTLGIRHLLPHKLKRLGHKDQPPDLPFEHAQVSPVLGLYVSEGGASLRSV